MEKAIFEKLQTHIYDKDNPWVNIWADKAVRPNKLPYFSSWAIYGENDLDNKEVIEDEVISSLNGNIVFVALNFSSPLKSWGPWKNIHGNYNVRWLLDGKNKNFNTEKIKKYKGAYITDIIKNIIGSDASKVMNELDFENINKNIGWFFEEIELLGSDCIEMYLFGGAVGDLFRNYVQAHKEFGKFRKKVKKCQEIYHYSGSNNGRFRKYAPEQLGLINLSTPNIKKILWDDK